MKHRIRHAIISLAGAAGVLLLSGACASYPADRTWTVKGPELPLGLLVELAAPAGQPASFRISGGALQGAVVTGSAVADGPGWELTPTGMDWFNNWAAGWTEAHFILDGKLSLQPDAGGWRLGAAAAPEIDVPDRAKIRYRDSYFYGDKALTKFTNRWERIQAAVGLLAQKFPESWWDRTKGEFSWSIFGYLPSFEDGVKQFLFPEVFGYPSPPPGGYRTRFAESILWNTDYSDANFPESLRPVRNSGTLYRDFEESPGLWHLAFGWTRLWTERLPAVVITKYRINQPEAK